MKINKETIVIFRHIVILLVISLSTLLCYSLYTSYCLNFVFLKNEFNLKNFMLSFGIIIKLLIKLCMYFSLEIHLFFVVSIVVVWVIDRISSFAILFLYVSIILTCGLGIELKLLSSTTEPSLISAIWFRVDLIYTDAELRNAAYTFLRNFNIEHKTKYDMIKEASLVYLIQESKGKVQPLLDRLLKAYIEHNKNRCKEKKEKKEEKIEDTMFYIENLYHMLWGWWNGTNKK